MFFVERFVLTVVKDYRKRPVSTKMEPLGIHHRKPTDS